MKDANVIYKKCIEELASIGIEPMAITAVTVNTRAKKRWGQARFDPQKRTWSISISSRLLEDSLPDWPAKNTMIHEILHCVEGCASHKGKWKELAQKCNRLLGTQIQRCSNYSEVIQNDYVPKRMPVKYICRCDRCGADVRRKRMSNFIKYPERYIHRGCGGHFKRII